MSDDQVFMDLSNDWAFKRFFGEEHSKERTRSFLNSFLPQEDQIFSLELKPTVKHGNSPKERQAVFDLACVTHDKRQIIIEMQNAAQKYFIERSIFNLTFPIQEQAKKGKWNYHWHAVYFVNILNFSQSGMFENDGDYLHMYGLKSLKSLKSESVLKKLLLVYAELPNFTKRLEDLDSVQDHWLYLMKHLPQCKEVPPQFADPIFKEAFEVARVASFNKDELMAYKASEKNARDYHSSVEFAVEKEMEKVMVELDEVRRREEEARRREDDERRQKEEARRREEEARRQKDEAWQQLAVSAKKLEAFGMEKVAIGQMLGLSDDEVDELLK
jgi:predicted transposase/invertase (TIGR01784 family)